MWRQREHTTTAARARILGLTHSQRDLEDRMHNVSRAMQYELRMDAVGVLVYISDEDSVYVDAAAPAKPHISWKEARSLDQDVHTKIIDIRKVAKESHVAKMLTSYQFRYVMPLNHADQRVGYIFMNSKRGLNAWQQQLIDGCYDDLADALASALNTHTVHARNSVLEQKIASVTDEFSQGSDQASELDNARNEFVSMASHQLRTPLTSIKGYLSMVLEGDAGEITKEQRKLLSEAFLSSERMVRLISDFLNVSRVQTGKFMIDKKDVDLAMVVKQEVNQLKVNASARGLTLETTVPDSPILVQADEGKIRQVLMNFIDNAIYYSPEKTTITVALVEKASDIEITVKDQGIGVPLDEQTKLFEKFFRASNARMQRPDGTGVGLYLAKQVVDGHGGKIIFASTPGQGSTFGFSVPKK